ncbi:MAG: alkaline phosphatase family protein [Thermoplasmata archaeon]
MKKILSALIVLILILVLFIPLAEATTHSDSTKTPVKHVINIFLENHTFDNFFGIYPSDPDSLNTSMVKNLSVPVNLLQNISLLNSLSAVPPYQYYTADPVEGYLAYHADWNNGKMNNFKIGSGPQSMTYYTSSQLGPLWDLAEQYSIADMYFAPQMSESAPNTLYYYAGYSPVFNDYGPSPYIPFSETIFGELNSFNISWGAFVYNPASKSFDESAYIAGLNTYSDHIQGWNTFISDLANGTLPSVSWIFSQDTNGGQYTMGAPYNVLKGELWIMYIINKIESSPIWNSTTVFITWDDPGGYYDQVSPPTLDGVQLGMRLPLIVVSPYAKEDYISSTVMNHASILAFIDYNWNIPALNRFVSYSNIPLDMFNFNEPYQNGNVARVPISFNAVPLPSSIEFNLPSNSSRYNFSSIFPMTPQYPFITLNYSRLGSSTVNLSTLNSGIFVTNDISETPFYYTPAFFILIIIIDAILLALIIWIRGGSYDREK